MNRIKRWFKRYKEKSLVELFRIIFKKIAPDKLKESRYTPFLRVDLSSLSYDCGDLRKIAPYLPNVKYRSNDRDNPFKGNIYSLNW